MQVSHGGGLSNGQIWTAVLVSRFRALSKHRMAQDRSIRGKGHWGPESWQETNREGPVGGNVEGRWAAGKGEAVGGVGVTAPIRRLSSKCPNK